MWAVVEFWRKCNFSPVIVIGIQGMCPFVFKVLRDFCP